MFPHVQYFPYIYFVTKDYTSKYGIFCTSALCIKICRRKKKDFIYALGVSWGLGNQPTLCKVGKDTITHLWKSLFSDQQAESCHTSLRSEADSPAPLVVPNYAPPIVGRRRRHCAVWVHLPGNTLSRALVFPWEPSEAGDVLVQLLWKHLKRSGARFIFSRCRTATDLWCTGHVETVQVWLSNTTTMRLPSGFLKNNKKKTN